MLYIYLLELRIMPFETQGFQYDQCEYWWKYNNQKRELTVAIYPEQGNGHRS
jgi:hypothetical protein